MTSFDAVTSTGMNELPPCQRAVGEARYPHGHPNPWQALLALSGQQWGTGVIFGGPGRSCAQAARQKQPALHLWLRESCTATASSPGLSLLLYWKGSVQQPINYRRLTYSARHPAGYFESHCPLRQITGGWTWHLMTCSYFDWTLILLAPFNTTQVFQLTEVILWISSPGCG